MVPQNVVPELTSVLLRKLVTECWAPPQDLNKTGLAQLYNKPQVILRPLRLRAIALEQAFPPVPWRAGLPKGFTERAGRFLLKLGLEILKALSQGQL